MNKKRITIDDFLESKKITQDELKQNFEFVKTIKVDTFEFKKCPNCGDVINYSKYPATSWTEVHRCIACDTIMITFMSDRMSGNYIDTIDVYKDQTE